MNMQQKKPRREEEISIREGYIRLGQFLKLAGAVDNGIEAKIRIQAGEVTVNNEIDTRRGKKLVAGDLVGIDDKLFRVVAEHAAS